MSATIGVAPQATTAPKSSGGFRYLHENFGTNARMTELQAAIGRVQLRRLNRWIDLRTKHANFLMKMLSEHPVLHFHVCPSHSKNAYYRLYGFLDESLLAPDWCRDRILHRLSELGEFVGCGSSGEIYREKAFDIFPQVGKRQVAKRLHDTSLAFNVHPTLTQDMLNKTVKSTIAVLDEATGLKIAKRAAA